jgi:hypothetical protein
MSMVAISLLTPSLVSAGQPNGLPENVIRDQHERSAITIVEREEGCILTAIYLSASDDTDDWIDGSNQDERYVSFFAYQEDVCQDEIILNAEFSTSEIGFDVSPHLSGASINGQAVATSTSGDDIPVSVDVRWTPSGPRIFHQYSATVYAFDPRTGDHVLAHQDETQIDRQANARGTITVGDQIFQINDRSDNTFFVGFDLTWTMLAQ